jgi:hypothetical protein
VLLVAGFPTARTPVAARRASARAAAFRDAERRRPRRLMRDKIVDMITRYVPTAT